MHWTDIRPPFLDVLGSAPHAVDGLHDQREHGQRSQRVPDRGRHQQDLRLRKTPRSIRPDEPALIPPLRLFHSGGVEKHSSHSLRQEAAWTVTDECIQVMGGMGFMKVSAGGHTQKNQCTRERDPGLDGRPSHNTVTL